MARDLWLNLRKVLRIGKIRKTITIPAASYNCGPVRGSVSQTQSVSALRATGLSGSNTVVSIDFWTRQLPNRAFSSWYLLQYLGTTNNRGITIELTSGSVIVKAITASGTYTITVNKLIFSFWHRLSVTWSTTSNLLSFYIDGVLCGTAATVGNFTDTTFDLVFADAVFNSQIIGNIAQVSIYSVEKTAEAILQTGTYKGNLGAYGGNTSYYWKLTENYSPTVGAVSMTQGSSSVDSSKYPPIGFGGSFIVAQTDIDIGKATSLVFPKKQPAGVTGQFCVSWTDDNGDFQRRALWTDSQVDIAPNPSPYRGEKLNAPFRLELWNIDGEEVCVIPDDIIFEITDCTNPTSASDRTQVAAVTPTIDTTLAQAFPLTPFPLTFNTQQTY